MDDPIKSVLRNFDSRAVSKAASLESRARQHHLPPVSVYRWWARRTEAVMGALVEAVATDRNDQTLTIADPFAGGGVVALAAVLRGHTVYAQDINPWAARGLATMLALPDLVDLADAAARLETMVRPTLDAAYGTVMRDGRPATIAHTLRVMTNPCPSCSSWLRLYPGGLVSMTERVDASGCAGWLACRSGHLVFGEVSRKTTCTECDATIDPSERYTDNRRVTCPHCNWDGNLSEVMTGGAKWEIALVERVTGSSREIDVPAPLERTLAEPSRWRCSVDLGKIEAGRETAVLRRHGFRKWEDLYPARQRFVMERVLDCVGAASDGQPEVEHALRTAVYGAAEMAGHTARWDARYLKAYEATANHRFSVTTLAAEPNVWGAGTSGRGTLTRRFSQFSKASAWMRERCGRTLRVQGPLLSEAKRRAIPSNVDVRVVQGASQRIVMPAGSMDAIITDPPYHDDVQYTELSGLFRAWAGLNCGSLAGDLISQRAGKASMATYESTLRELFMECARVLKTRSHLVLSYANREPGAWIALFEALQAAGFRAVGYEIVHSENETDHAKSGKRACVLDVLLDLVAAGFSPVQLHRPSSTASGDEERYCRLIGKQALLIGQLAPGWAPKFEQHLRKSAFLSPPAPADQQP